MTWLRRMVVVVAALAALGGCHHTFIELNPDAAEPCPAGCRCECSDAAVEGLAGGESAP